MKHWLRLFSLPRFFSLNQFEKVHYGIPTKENGKPEQGMDSEMGEIGFYLCYHDFAQ